MAGYNKNRGHTLWCRAEHWRYARDRAWMRRAAPHLAAGCDGIVRERKALMPPNADGTRRVEHGFLPAGSLEDVQDYRCWKEWIVLPGNLKSPKTVEVGY